MIRRIIAAAVAVVFVGACAATVQATPGSGVNSTPLVKGRLESLDAKVKTGDWKIDLTAKSPSTIQVTEHRLSPGGWFGWHAHPGPSLVVVKEGTLSFYLAPDDGEACTPQLRQKGDSFVDPGGVVHTARNETSSEVVLIVTQLMPEGAQGRIDAPKPDGCPF